MWGKSSAGMQAVSDGGADREKARRKREIKGEHSHKKSACKRPAKEKHKEKDQGGLVL